ncbi:hypothetical protein BCR33DRAFT_853600 [Rhizoclosmatium globosum]|uniref:Uncharacterized protein n=1 Tax=Rhizoclosmatium globosum TaxID=329046 RepID=A0A1Y2BW92_9FUNG|nr:hypothetical protein BCR33DRAFT_853600 [Rhizoclosmatium globosum]|eukprot:ORY39022.1 hypothetical protein BCR33DRAFT_853600 [Rhizoclosmatium globosum]
MHLELEAKKMLADSLRSSPSKTTSMPAPIRNANYSSTSTTSYGYGQQLGGFPEDVINKAHTYANTGAEAVKQILDKYPPVKAFVIAFIITIALPVTVFASITGSTFLGAIAVAGSGVALFQGLVLAIAGFVFFWFALGAFLFAASVGLGFTAVYFGLQMAKAVANRANEKI